MVQSPVKLIRRVVAPPQRVAGIRKSHPANKATYQVNITKRRKRLAAKIQKVINHKLSCYRTPIVTKPIRETSTQQYTLKKNI